jgi:hypothetical protein
VFKTEPGERQLDLVEFLIVVHAIGADETALIRTMANSLSEGAVLWPTLRTP